MRIIAGKVKGHQIKAPKRIATRPATDLVRGSIFSILASLANDYSKVLDLFSGSGALGIEALSRGAEWVDFVEHSSLCCAIIKQNLEKTRFTDKAHIYCCEVKKALSFLDKLYDIILVDPPYSDRSIGDLIVQLSAGNQVGPDSVLVVTHSPHHPLGAMYGSLNRTREYRHGDSCIAVYQRESEI
jgi:16S rRNA (guanine(966)-N(2))-methyltransferase RsmD